MSLSIASIATMFQNKGWVPMSTKRECYTSDKTPVSICIHLNPGSSDKATGSIELIANQENITLERENFVLNIDGLNDAIDTAEKITIG